jgi:hypothetical protein
LRALPDGHVDELKDDIHKHNERSKILKNLPPMKREATIIILNVRLRTMRHLQAKVLRTELRICICSWYSILVSRGFLEFRFRFS